MARSVIDDVHERHQCEFMLARILGRRIESRDGERVIVGYHWRGALYLEEFGRFPVREAPAAPIIEPARFEPEDPGRAWPIVLLNCVVVFASIALAVSIVTAFVIAIVRIAR